jgi:glutathione synthase
VPLKVAVQMDPIERVKIAGDSTFALLLEAQARGHEISYYTPDKLAMLDGEVFVTAQPLSVRDKAGDHFTLGEENRVKLSIFDVVLLRQDPPFDMNYITTTHLLERVHPKTLVVNDPAAVRNAPEKMLVNDFHDLMPPKPYSRARKGA